MATNDDTTKELIREQFEQLPDVVQETILNSKWENKIRRIVQNNKLHIDQGAALENLVFFTMLGIKSPDDFIQNAGQFVGLEEEKAYAISLEVEREIFGDIRRKLVQITDTANTVDDIGRVTDELDKVAGDIADRAKSESIIENGNNEPLVVGKENQVPTLDISGKKKERRSLKESIPVDYFDKSNQPESDNAVADPYHEPINEELAQTPPKDITNVTFDERLSEKQIPKTESNKVKADENLTSDSIPINKDPYREEVEGSNSNLPAKQPAHDLQNQPDHDLLVQKKKPLVPIINEEDEMEEKDSDPVHIIESEINIPGEDRETINEALETVATKEGQNNLKSKPKKKGRLFGIFKKKEVVSETETNKQIAKDSTTTKEESEMEIEAKTPEDFSIIADGLTKPIVTKKEEILFEDNNKKIEKPGFVEKPQTEYEKSDDPYREPVE